MGLFEMNETIKQSMATQLWYLLEKFGLLHQMIVFVKDEGINLTIIIAILHSIIDYEPLKILKVYEGTCFRHAMSKAYQYATNDNKIYVGLEHVNVKNAEVGLQKTITWTKKFTIRRENWEHACAESGMQHQKLKIPMKMKFTNNVIMFEKIFEFKNDIIPYYGKQKIMA